MLLEMWYFTGFLTSAPVALAIFHNLHTQLYECPSYKCVWSVYSVLITILLTSDYFYKGELQIQLLPYEKRLLSFLPVLNSSIPALCWCLLSTIIPGALVPWSHRFCTTCVFLLTHWMRLNALWGLFLRQSCLHTPINCVLDRHWVFTFINTFHLI